MIDQKKLATAIKAWRQSLTQDVLDYANAQNQYGACTTLIQRKILAALRPCNRNEVEKVVCIANEYRIPLYPISTGNNWGYGTANPIVDDCVIVDLSQMQKIYCVDRELGIVDLEPGVTQQALHHYLKENNLPYMVPATGAGPNCSIIGNALERGYGLTPHTDHFSAVTSLEVVLPDGRIYNKALAKDGPQINQLYKWGTGAYLDGIFSQSNFGITTRMSIALAAKPERIQAFFFSIEQDDQLEDAVNTVREVLRCTQGITGSINLMNRHRVLPMVSPYPLENQLQGGLISETTLDQLAKKNKITAWTGVGAIYGDKAIVKSTQAVIKRLLKPHASRLHFLNSSKIGMLQQIFDFFPGMKKSQMAVIIKKITQTLEIMEGQPNELGLTLAYWKSGKPSGDTKNPAKDGCGLIWYSPLVPMKAAEVRSFTTMVHDVCRDHKIEPLITLTSLSGQCFDSTIPILFDKQDKEAAARAQECYFALYEAGRKLGFLPYRMGVHSMQHVTDQQDNIFWQLSQELKQTLDPNNIISPGRYTPSNRS